MPDFSWLPALARIVWQTFGALWHGYGTGPIAVILAVAVYAANIGLRSRDMRRTDPSVGVVEAVRRTIRPAWESPLTKITIRCWIVLFVYQFGSVIWSHHQKLSETLFTTARTLTDQNKELTTALNTPKYCPPPPDPDHSLMSPSVMLAMIGAIRRAVTNHGFTTFVISSYPGNEWVRSDLEGVLALTCQGGDLAAGTQNGCNVSPAPLTSRRQQQGLTIHVSEPKLIGSLVPGQPPAKTLGSDFPAALAQWFIVTKDPSFSDAVIEQVGDVFPKSNTVWIEVGPGSPWNDDDIRLKQNMTRKDIDNLRNWGLPLKEHLRSIATRLDKMPRTTSGMGSYVFMVSGLYNGLISEAYSVCNEAKYSDGMNTGPLEKAILDAQDYQHQKIDEIRDLLLQLSDEVKAVK